MVVTLVSRALDCNIIVVTYLQHFCDGFLGVGNFCHFNLPQFSKPLQNCCKFVTDELLCCLHTVSKSGGDKSVVLVFNNRCLRELATYIM